MNKEQRKFKKVMKQRARRKKFDRIQVDAKIKKARIMQKEKINYKFDRLQRRIENDKNIKKSSPVFVPPPFSGKQKVV